MILESQDALDPTDLESRLTIQTLLWQLSCQGGPEFKSFQNRLSSTFWEIRLKIFIPTATRQLLKPVLPILPKREADATD